MRSYLNLIPISARVHRRQNRMTLLCIIISVFLVTAIFSVADMFVRTNGESLQEKHGNWHIRVDGISQGTAEEIARRPDVTAVGWCESFNINGDQPCEIDGKKAVLYGVDETYITGLVNALEEGGVPQNDSEVMLSSNAKLAFDIQVGDTVTVHTPAGDMSFTVSGFGSDDKDYYRGQTYLAAVYMTRDAYHVIAAANGIEEHPSCYVQFKKASSGAVAKIREQYGLAEEDISENTVTMGLSGQSKNKSVQNIYGIAAVLFAMVLLAGVLMISGSLNSNITQRIKFFGMMRCVGASRRQVIRFVRLEALNWCKTAVPVGVILGTLASWNICAYMRYCIGGEFASMPILAISPVGLLSGVLVGIVTVLLAAQSPAKRAAKVSPVAAVSGNSEIVPARRHAIRRKVKRVERTLGIHHATASKRNWFLMTASFALTIILILCFSIGLDFAKGLMPSLRSWQPDIVLNGYLNALVIGQDVKEKALEIPGVQNVFGTAYLNNVPAVSSRRESTISIWSPTTRFYWKA